MDEPDSWKHSRVTVRCDDSAQTPPPQGAGTESLWQDDDELASSGAEAEIAAGA